MKKTIIPFMALLLFVSCSQMVKDIDANYQEKPERNSNEITINGFANPTRSIIEGTTVPFDNAIGLFTNFHSDDASVDFSLYNKNNIYGYDSEKGMWRSITPIADKSETPSLLNPNCNHWGGIFNKAYSFSPQYWPIGDRVYMDYVAYSYNNLVDMVLEAAKCYVTEEEMNKVSLHKIIDNLRYVKPIVKNANRIDINYEDNVMNFIGGKFFEIPKTPILDPMALVVGFAICKLAGIETGMADFDSQPLTMENLESIVSDFRNLDPFNFMWNYDDLVSLFDDYDMAYWRLMDDPYDYDNMSKERYEEVVNYTYWFFLTHLPLVCKYIQDDLMFAYDRNLANNSGAVQTKLNHAKAWVKVVINNQTDKDIFVSEITFDDVKTGGNLVIDNSKSGFEAYWDFSDYQAYQPENNAVSKSRNGASLDGKSSDRLFMSKARNRLKIKRKTLKSTSGFIPDMYFVPSGCYGPALNIEKFSTDKNENSLAKSASEQDSSFYPEYHGLRFNYLSGDQPFDKRVAQNLSGAMFPAQEPGVINFTYYSWDAMPKTKKDNNTVSQELEMGNAIKYLHNNLKSENLHKVTLNLPRQTWQMGKTYVYVLTINENEVSLSPTTEEWE